VRQRTRGSRITAPHAPRRRFAHRAAQTGGATASCRSSPRT
jgi:hypothetical protein